jgi:hypothetical protein
VREHPLTGPLLVLTGAAAFLVISLLTWYAIDLGQIQGGAGFAQRFADQAGFATSANAWEPWGLVTDLIYAAAIAGGIALGAGGLSGAVHAPGAAGAATILGGLTSAIVLLHLISPPSPGDIVEVRAVAWLGLLAALAMTGGGFLWWERLHHEHGAVRAGEPEPS